MKSFLKTSSIFKVATAFAFLLFVSNGLKAQTAYVTNYSAVALTVTVYGATTCVAGEYDCEATILTVPAATSSGPGQSSVTLSCLGSYIVTAEVDESNSSNIGVVLKTPNCLCGQGAATDSDSFTSSGGTITADAACSGQDMYIEIN